MPSRIATPRRQISIKQLEMIMAVLLVACICVTSWLHSFESASVWARGAVSARDDPLLMEVANRAHVLSNKVRSLICSRSVL